MSEILQEALEGLKEVFPRISKELSKVCGSSYQEFLDSYVKDLKENSLPKMIKEVREDKDKSLDKSLYKQTENKEKGVAIEFVIYLLKSAIKSVGGDPMNLLKWGCNSVDRPLYFSEYDKVMSKFSEDIKIIQEAASAEPGMCLQKCYDLFAKTNDSQEHVYSVEVQQSSCSLLCGVTEETQHINQASEL